MQIKTTIKAIALGLSLTIPSVHAGFPVSVLVDVPGQLAQFQNMAQMLKEYATMLDQLNKMQEQLQQMEREYNSVTGTRGLGNILNNPDFSKHLPDNWQTILRNIRYNGYEGLDGAAKALRDASKVIDSCEYIEDRVERQNCAALALKPVQDQAFATNAYQKSYDRTAQIESLMNEINRTRDPKAIAELSARIQAEQALIQNEQTKLSMYQATSESEQRLLLQQQKEINSRTWRSKNYGADVPPMEF
ncbi:attachment mediating protein VirB5-like protein (plasmid) [Aliivibrio fischeri ES114]|uniref:Attachment mediating protein VirB5-like protein n=1 Tax=Aliivibrio fischeri (strain ATCC 700601 / ES114) TaxID=312309 RepID=Q5DY50_ALIF1|nr:P-type DNA transfer protein VirB5 [Aliivibrio fischeri]AAW88296.1 attachment mediating protein VirB5-like protein [Aliivibrio fischeri ES114]KLU77270.1 type IV secretion protein VirB5 [Aliivibrio fischeri]MBP3155173.1 P-type DNA transfer protein VirB5 [Aliivibrio fischeri]MBP3155230.1 P-type DNA transfer protein VirB5 [Aliivibrio fischeri]MCE7575557.1 P-type DNA transfer protein VirB5 [Aliivibrio fischeri]